MSTSKSFSQIYKSKHPVLSFEFFPPKSADLLAETKAVMRRMTELEPNFMTVTYGAGGGTRGLTRELTKFISRELNQTAVAHLTCVGHTVQEIDEVLLSLKTSGVNHILALRGDPPKGDLNFSAPQGGFSCARDLANHIKKSQKFSIAIAGYPETHPEAVSRQAELEYMKDKVTAGGEVIFTQLFFQAELYINYVNDLTSHGVNVPVIPGILPISNVKQLERFTSMCGATIPAEILGDLKKISKDSEAVKNYGIELAYQLCLKLLAAGAPGLHFYTLNRNDQVEAVCQKLRADRVIS